MYLFIIALFISFALSGLFLNSCSNFFFAFALDLPVKLLLNSGNSYSRSALVYKESADFTPIRCAANICIAWCCGINLVVVVGS